MSNWIVKTSKIVSILLSAQLSIVCWSIIGIFAIWFQKYSTMYLKIFDAFFIVIIKLMGARLENIWYIYLGPKILNYLKIFGAMNLTMIF